PDDKGSSAGQQQGGAGQQPGAAGQPLGEKSEMTTTSATVDSIDKKNRTVTLTGQAGDRFTVQVPKSVKAFDTLKKGDMVDIDYYQSVALALLQPGETPPPGMHEKTGTTRSATGGMTTKQTTSTVEIISVDTTDNTVKFRASDGSVRTVT